MKEMDSDSENDYTGWNFTAARKLLRASRKDLIAPPPASFDLSTYLPPKEAPSKGLGDFDRLLKLLRKPGRHLDRSDADSYTSSSNQSTPPTSAQEDNAPIEHFDDLAGRPTSGKGVRWKDEIAGQDLADFRRRSLQSEKVANTLDETDTETDVNYTPTPKSRHKKSRSKDSTQIKSSIHLLPASVPPAKGYLVPKPLDLPHQTLFLPGQICPLYTLTKVEQEEKLVRKLARRFGNSVSLTALARLGCPLETNGIHIFVDLSNIAIGFWDRIKMLRNLPYARNPPINFASLALILERGRQVARRVLAGSTMSIAYDGPPKLPWHVLDAQELGYESNILERVTKLSSNPNKSKKKRGTGSGYATSGNSSTSDSAFVGRMKNQEQAVDELLQMKMLESIVDTEQPSTLVLASGDAAEAEFSGGFLKNVERALSKGWQVEVVAWRDAMSFEYKSPGLTKKWGNRLKIIELDDFCEELLAMYTFSYRIPGDLY